jgi:cystathionine beta-synthase
MYSDDWMRDQGFLETERAGDLRDLIGRRFDQGAAVTITPGDTLQIAYARMKLYDVSQLPVLEGDHVVGLIDESDLLLAVLEKGLAFENLVRDAMATNIETVDVSGSIQTLLPIFERGYVAVVVDGPHFLGLITRIDLLNHLRRRKE